MRGKKMYSIAVGTPEGSICVEDKDVANIFSRNGIFKFPVFRGIAAVIETMPMGLTDAFASSRLDAMERKKTESRQN